MAAGLRLAMDLLFNLKQRWFGLPLFQFSAGESEQPARGVERVSRGLLDLHPPSTTAVPLAGPFGKLLGSAPVGASP